MPREVKTSVDTRQVLNPISAPKATEVVARPTDQFIQPALDPELAGLIQGLSGLNPSLQQYAYASRFDQAKDNEKDQKAGVAARQQGQEIPKGSPEYFKHGYMMMDGQVKGDLDGGAFKNRYLTEFDKDSGSIEDFAKTHFADNLKGVTDKSFLEGYNQTIAKHIESVRDDHLKFQQDAIVSKTETNGMYKLDQSLRAYAENGEAIPDVVIDSQRKDMKNLGISGSRFNDLLFASMKVIGDEGNYSIYDTLKKDKPDGTPGMYYIPGMKEKIDAAQIHSQNVYLQKGRQAEVALKQQREDKQDLALYDVFAKVDSDPEGAQQDYNNLRTSGLFSRASELVEWDSKFATTSKREASAGQQQQELDIQQGIYTGSVRPANIMKADITPAQKRSLMGEWYRVKNDNQQAAANGQKSADAIYKTQHFDSGRDYIRTVLRPQASPLDPMGIGTEFARQQLATAEREFVEAARKVKDPQELYGISQEITTRYLDRAKSPRIQKELDNAGSIRYDSIEELQAARRAGKINDPIEFQNQLRYFKATTGQKPNG